MLELKPHESYIINTPELFLRLKTYCEKVKSEFLCFDTETDSLVEKTTRLFGLGLSLTDSKAFYICWRDKTGNIIWTDKQQKEIISWFYKLCETKKLIAHNAIFDILVIDTNFDIDISKFLHFDTLIAAHCIDEEGSLGLKDLGKQWFGEDAVAEQNDLKDSVIANGGKWLKGQKDMYLAESEILGKYCNKDVVLTYNIFKIYEQKLKEEELEDLFYIDELMPLMREVVIPMKKHGFPIDIQHFKQLKVDIEAQLIKLEDEIMQEIKEDTKPFITSLLDSKVPVKSSGILPKKIAQQLCIPLPTKKSKNKETGEITYKETLGEKDIIKQIELFPQFSNFYNWILDKEELKIDNKVLFSIRESVYLERQDKSEDGEEPTSRYSFNLNSSDHLAYYFFNVCKYKPKGKTPTGKAKLNAEFLNELKADNETAQKILDYKKLQKLNSTYVIGVLDRQVNGRIHTSMLLAGTTSGRFASRDPNLNNLPAAKKGKSLISQYTNAIRRGFVAGPGKSIVGSDFSALEPHLAAWASQDKGLIDIFVTGKDFYSEIGIKQFEIKDATAFKDESPDSFPIKYPELRNLVKAYALASIYGAENFRIGQITNKTPQEAQKLLDGYFKAFPGVKKFINDTHKQVKQQGFVKTRFGRVRHLKTAQELYQKYGNDLLDYRWAKSKNLLRERSIFKNLLNNAVNMQIQGTAAHCLNRAMLKMTRQIKKENRNSLILLSIHDEVLVQCDSNEAEEVAKIVKDSMENCIDISPIKLKATPIIGDSYGACK
jgi:DNA polymerase I-like protein with 3'-5' exonuclease and polymerase domains